MRHTFSHRMLVCDCQILLDHACARLCCSVSGPSVWRIYKLGTTLYELVHLHGDDSDHE